MADSSDSKPESGASVESANYGASESWAIATERARLAAQQAAGERLSHKLHADSPAPAAPPSTPEVSAISRDRLRRLAILDPELRTQLHIIMGNIQLLRLQQGLDTQLGRRLDGMLAAGGELLGKIHDVHQLSDVAADFSPCSIDTRQGFPETDPNRDGLHVLVVDDIEMNRDIASSLLRGAGHRVSLAEDGAAALLIATQLDFDVILMDLRMPRMDGMEATRRIRTLPGARGQVPVIALTAKASADEVAACRAAGMSGHLAKPFRHDTLEEAVERAAASRPARIASAASLLSGASPADLSASQLRALIAPPAARADFAADRGTAEAWVDIVSPWSMPAQPHPLPWHAGVPAGSCRFALSFKRDRAGDLCNFANLECICVPAAGRDQHEYHWLLFVETGASYPDHFTTECELWRWHRGTWRSVAVPGASFSPADMYRDGWRYCGPCDNPTVQVHIVAPTMESDGSQRG